MREFAQFAPPATDKASLLFDGAACLGIPLHISSRSYFRPSVLWSSEWLAWIACLLAAFSMCSLVVSQVIAAGSADEDSSAAHLTYPLRG